MRTTKMLIILLLQGRDTCERHFCSMKRHFVSTGFKMTTPMKILDTLITRMCRELRKKDILSEVLRLSHDRSLNKYADVDDEDDFQVFFIFIYTFILLSSKLT